MRAAKIILALVVGFAMTANAAGPDDYLKRLRPAEKGAVDASGVYKLSAEEQGYNCKQLTARMQLRILDIRDHMEKTQPSFLALSFKWLMSLFYAGAASASPGGQYAEDRAMLVAFNRRLAEKKCPAFDLAAELVPKDVSETPTPLARRK